MGRRAGAILLASAAVALSGGAAEAAWFSRKAKALPPDPAAYDFAAIDALLYPLPDYDTASLDQLVSVVAPPDRPDPGRWKTSTRLLPQNGRSVRRLKLTRAGDEPEHPTAGGEAYAAILYTETWPSLLSGSIGDVDLDLSPHTTFATGPFGRSSGAGVVARLGRLGFAARDAGEISREGHWFLFGAVSREAVGWTFARDGDGVLRGLGLTHDRASGLIAEAQAGVAWKKGPMQAAFGYTRRRVRMRGGLAEWSDNLDLDLFPKSDDAVTFSFTYTPEPER